MSIEVRVADPSEYASVIDTISTAFVERPDIEKVAAVVRRTWRDGRLVAAFDGERAVGTFRAFSTELTVPGLAVVPAAAISAVGVRPSHRRQGILARMAAAAHADIVARGEVAAVLYASEYPIYGRFGYGPATLSADSGRECQPGGVPRSGPRAAWSWSHPMLPPSRSCAGSTSGLVAHAPARSSNGTRGWPFRLGLEDEPWGDTWKGFLLIRRDAAGVADGYARYTGKPKWEHHLPANSVEVQELVAASGHAYRALWAFLLAIDLVTEVRGGGLQVNERLPWLLRNARAARSEGPAARYSGPAVRRATRPRGARVRALGQPRPRSGGRRRVRRPPALPARRVGGGGQLHGQPTVRRT